jgi:hypothetical protein
MNPTDWLPFYPDLPPRALRVRQGPALAQPPRIFSAPDLLATLTFLPCFPDQVPHRRSQIAWTERIIPPFTAAIAPSAWRPIYPDRVPHLRLRAAAQPAYFEPPPSVQVLIAQSLTWRAIFPDRVVHHRPVDGGGSFDAIAPTTVAAGMGCLQLIDEALMSPAFVSERLTSPSFLAEALGSPALINEDLC